MTVTAPVDDGGAPALTGFHRIFETLHAEHDYVIDEVEGRLPDGLVGTMYRNGPGKWEVGGAPLQHLLEGDGMISSVTFDGKSARFRNRYVRTPYYAQGLGDGGMTYRTAGTLIPGGLEANAGREVAAQANTNVMMAGGRLVALYGGAKPWDIDPVTLETLGQWDVGGMLGPDRPGFSAHAKIDPRTGEFLNFSTQPLPTPMVHTFSIDRTGTGTRLASVEAPFAHWVHDFAITERHFVFAMAPFQFHLDKMMSGEMSPSGSLHLKPELGTVFLIVPRDGGAPRIIEHDAFAYFHLTNAFEDGDDIVLDLSEFSLPFEQVNQAMFDYRTGGLGYFANVPTRYRVSKSGKVSREQLAGFLSDWPQLDWRHVGVRNRYSYHATVEPDTAAGGLGRIDHQTGRVTQHQLPAGHITGEPSFVPARPTAGEDDGWVLFTAYDPAEHRSRIVVLDARDVEGDAVTVLRLRHHVPLQFHGSFVSPKRLR